jgi:hypothetical protein
MNSRVLTAQETRSLRLQKRLTRRLYADRCSSRLGMLTSHTLLNRRAVSQGKLGKGKAPAFPVASPSKQRHFAPPCTWRLEGKRLPPGPDRPEGLSLRHLCVRLSRPTPRPAPCRTGLARKEHCSFRASSVRPFVPRHRRATSLRWQVGGYATPQTSIPSEGAGAHAGR